MNRRKKKKIENRCGFYHYSDYKSYSKALDSISRLSLICNKKYEMTVRKLQETYTTDVYRSFVKYMKYVRDFPKFLKNNMAEFEDVSDE